MNWYKNIISILLILLLSGLHPVSLWKEHNILLPMNEDTIEEEIFSKLAAKDISKNIGKNLFSPLHSLSNNTTESYITTFYLPITFYFIRLLTNSSRGTRLPPAH